jgi:hypothetical protein
LKFLSGEKSDEDSSKYSWRAFVRVSDGFGLLWCDNYFAQAAHRYNPDAK